ncbi:hypothetical protein Bhyg_08820 [Pseudolycoriella hygida]|uniref:Uncharacterized protein n=1 Tax=Pseudolycoriella hygida TaxID=35572 RepID=A0A9Q0S567_9DIPT|nr:hypothetical protein Bhyg_08820 [Pseudolycoriella hygida]
MQRRLRAKHKTMNLKIILSVVLLCCNFKSDAQTAALDLEMTITTALSSEEVGEAPDTTSARGIVSDIAAIKKVVQVIQTVGEKVIPAIVEKKSSNDPAIKPPRFKLLKALKPDAKEEQVATQA